LWSVSSFSAPAPGTKLKENAAPKPEPAQPYNRVRYFLILNLNLSLKSSFHRWCLHFSQDDYNRVVLEPLPDVPDSDYINASYVDSHHSSYIITKKTFVFAYRKRNRDI
ncbi:hypothetical protein Anas_02985, partial [Armadillidium nasatum]